MSCITTCTACGQAYEEASEALANDPTERHCSICHGRNQPLALHGLTEQQWIDLARRVGNGTAVERDADYVEAIGLLPQAMRIRQGLGTFADAVLINMQAGIQLLDRAGVLRPSRRVAA